MHYSSPGMCSCLCPWKPCTPQVILPQWTPSTVTITLIIFPSESHDLEKVWSRGCGKPALQEKQGTPSSSSVVSVIAQHCVASHVCMWVRNMLPTDPPQSSQLLVTKLGIPALSSLASCCDSDKIIPSLDSWGCAAIPYWSYPLHFSFWACQILPIGRVYSV